LFKEPGAMARPSGFTLQDEGEFSVCHTKSSGSRSSQGGISDIVLRLGRNSITRIDEQAVFMQSPSSAKKKRSTMIKKEALEWLARYSSTCAFKRSSTEPPCLPSAVSKMLLTEAELIDAELAGATCKVRQDQATADPGDKIAHSFTENPQAYTSWREVESSDVCRKTGTDEYGCDGSSSGNSSFGSEEYEMDDDSVCCTATLSEKERRESGVKRRASEHVMVAQLKSLAARTQLRMRTLPPSPQSASQGRSTRRSASVDPAESRQLVRLKALQFTDMYSRTLGIFEEHMTLAPPERRRHTVNDADLENYTFTLDK